MRALRLHKPLHTRSCSASNFDERGDTLVEVLLAVVILSLTVVALLGALTTSITGSGEHRNIAAIDTILKSYAEAAKYQIELQPVVTGSKPSGPIYEDCPGNSSTKVLTDYRNGVNGKWTPPPGYGAGSGYSVAITQVQPWNNLSSNWDPSCPSGGLNHDANGLQLLTVTATAPTNVSDQMQIAVRNPDYPSTVPNPYAGF